MAVNYFKINGTLILRYTLIFFRKKFSMILEMEFYKTLGRDIILLCLLMVRPGLVKVILLLDTAQIKVLLLFKTFFYLTY